MSKIIIGLDPDSDKHGIAIYRKRVLCDLMNLNTIQLYIHITTFEKTALKAGEIEIHMEDPKRNSSSEFSHHPKDKLKVKFKKSESVGKVKQAQTSIEQMADELGIKVVLYKNSSCWKKGADKKLFEKITGWTKRSNEDTRSAAWFGYLATKK